MYDLCPETDADAPEVEALIAARLQARADKNWAESDRIRDQLAAAGVALEDTADGARWSLTKTDPEAGKA